MLKSLSSQWQPYTSRPRAASNPQVIFQRRDGTGEYSVKNPMNGSIAHGSRIEYPVSHLPHGPGYPEDSKLQVVHAGGVQIQTSHTTTQFDGLKYMACKNTPSPGFLYTPHVEVICPCCPLPHHASRYPCHVD